MNGISQLVAERFGEDGHDSPFVTMSFRCSAETQIKIALLTPMLGYSSKSKFLNELVAAALDDAISHLPEAEQFEFDKQFEDELYVLHQAS